MGGILDRYIARQYLTNVLTLLVILFSFVVTVDVAWNFDRYWDVAAKLASENGQEATFVRRAAVFVFAVFDLWWPRLVQLYGFIVGMVLIAAMGFTCSQLVRHRELIAMLASGQSLRRVIRPFVAVALVFLALQAASQEFVLPHIAPLLARDQGDAGQRGLGKAAVPLMADGRGRLLHARAFDADNQRLEDVLVLERDEAGRATRRTTASLAEWDGSAWVLANPTVIEIDGPEVTRPDPVSRVRFETDLDPTGLTMRRFKRYAANLSFTQLTRMRNRSELFSESAIERLALLIAVPFFATRAPMGILPQALRCAPVAMGATLGGVFGASVALPGIPTLVGVALPVFVLTLIAVPLIASMRT